MIMVLSLVSLLQVGRTARHWRNLAANRRSGDPEDRMLPTGINLTLPNLDNDDDSKNKIFGTIAMERPPSYSDTHQFDLHHYKAPQLLREYYGFVAPLPLLPIDDSETIAPASTLPSTTFNQWSPLVTTGHHWLTSGSSGLFNQWSPVVTTG
jgi:hypothetical protein